MKNSPSYTVRKFSSDTQVPGEAMDNGEMSTSLEIDTMPFNVEDTFTDVVLEVEDQQIFTNRSLLAYASPVFSCMFTGEFKERNDKVIPLPDKSHIAVSEMIAYLHPGVGFTLTRDSVFRLLPLAEEYQISVLKKECENFLIRDIREQIYPTAEFLVFCLAIAERCGLSILQELCADKLSEPETSLKELKACDQIGLETKSKIFQMMISKMEKERADIDSWKERVNCAKQRLRDIVLPHEEHCRCHVEMKPRSYAQRSCIYCSRNLCSDNISTEAYKNSYQFFCSHKIGYHIAHDSTLRLFMDTVEFPI